MVSAGRLLPLAMLLVLAGFLSCRGRSEVDEPPQADAPATDLSENEGPGQPGRWQKLRRPLGEQHLTPEQKEAIARLQTLGYTAGSKPPVTEDVITVHVPDKVYSGLNFYVSGHAPEAVLMDMDGVELHRWRCELSQAWPDAPTDLIEVGAKEFWQRAYLYENGDVLAVFEGYGILKLDRDSNLIWARDNGAHHDLDVMPGGEIYVLTRNAAILPTFDAQKPVRNDFICVLDSGGHQTRLVSVLACYENSGMDLSLLAQEDLFHTNTIDVLDEREAAATPAGKPGDVLVSMRNVDLLAIVDLEQEKFVWTLDTPSPASSPSQAVDKLPLFFRQQHHPQLLANGHMLLFDNLGIEGRSTIWEFDPASRRVHWYYRGDERQPFYTEVGGTVQRLPNGNTLITESDYGRAFEVTPQKEIVWEFQNPHRAGDRRQFIAAMWELVRLPPDFPIDWARGRAK